MNKPKIFEIIENYYKNKKLISNGNYEYYNNHMIHHSCCDTCNRWYINFNNCDYYFINIQGEENICDSNYGNIFPDEINDYD